MSSKIEQQIDQIEDFIDSCRYQTFSKMSSTPYWKSCARERLRRSSTISASSIIKRRSLRTPDAKRKR